MEVLATAKHAIKENGRVRTTMPPINATIEKLKK
jgi:hypothetical protein